MDRAGAKARGREALRDFSSKPGKDRDEYSSTLFEEGGRGASVRPISPSDNRGAGASVGNQLRKHIDGTKVKIEVVDREMARSIDRLTLIGGDSICQEPAHFRTNILDSLGDLGRQLAGFLSRKNGFYAFESALHVFPACQKEGVMDLEKWNDPGLWIAEYHDMALGTFFFAEEIYGDQFGIRGREVVRFEAETGVTESIASSLEEWASLILKDCNYQTGYPLAHNWQQIHGPLPKGERLVATTPFVLGGDFDVANLFALDAVKAMRYHGDIALRIRGVPDGSKIIFKVDD
ncbi:MAG: SMI1/KNR4 family protein [Desulfomonilaceae bacterium]